MARPSRQGIFSAGAELSRQVADLEKLTDTRIKAVEDLRFSTPKPTNYVTGIYLAKMGDWVRADCLNARVIAILPQPKTQDAGKCIWVQKARGDHPLIVTTNTTTGIGGYPETEHPAGSVRALMTDGISWFWEGAALKPGIDTGSIDPSWHSYGLWTTRGNVAANHDQQGLAVAVTGTATARNVASTNVLTVAKRVGYVSAAAAGSSCGIRSGALQYFRGTTQRLGGFLFAARFGVSDAAPVANSRMFVGLYGTAAVIGNVEPSTLLNTIGIGCNAGGATLNIISNDGAGAATMTDLGSSWSSTSTTELYDFRMFSPPNHPWVDWRLERISDGKVAFGTIADNLPLNSTLLAPQIWRNNGATALAVRIDVGTVMIVTP